MPSWAVQNFIPKSHSLITTLPTGCSQQFFPYFWGKRFERLLKFKNCLLNNSKQSLPIKSSHILPQYYFICSGDVEIHLLPSHVRWTQAQELFSRFLFLKNSSIFYELGSSLPLKIPQPDVKYILDPHSSLWQIHSHHCPGRSNSAEAKTLYLTRQEHSSSFSAINL